MITAFYSSVLDYPVDRVWSLVRDFNNYPRYIDGVIESIIEDDKRGDEVGAVRRFNYQGNWIRQRLVRHSDDERLLTYRGSSRLHFRPTYRQNLRRRSGMKGPCSSTASSMATERSSNGRWSWIRRRAKRSRGTPCSWNGSRSGPIPCAARLRAGHSFIARVVIASHSRSKNGVASLAYGEAIQCAKRKNKRGIRGELRLDCSISSCAMTAAAYSVDKQPDGIRSAAARHELSEMQG